MENEEIMDQIKELIKGLPIQMDVDSLDLFEGNATSESSNFGNPEDACIQKDLFDKLSDEAKWVIKNIIIDGPSEVLTSFINTERVSVSKLTDYIWKLYRGPERKRGTQAAAEAVVKEIRDITNGFF